MPKITDPALRHLYWRSRDDGLRLYHGDVGEVLANLPDRCVQMVCTSPPYYALRTYKVGEGDRDKEIGSEKTPQDYIARLVQVFREVKRVLRDDGVVFLNMGGGYQKDGSLDGIPWRIAFALQEEGGWVLRSHMCWFRSNSMPESVTSRPGKSTEDIFMLTKGGSGYFYDHFAVRQEGSLSSLGRYKYPFGGKKDRDLLDQDKQGRGGNRTRPIGDRVGAPDRNFRNSDLWFQSVSHPYGLVGCTSSGTHGVGEGTGEELVGLDCLTRNYSGAHYAVFPPQLVEPLIKCGSSEYGSCATCGTCWRRVVEAPSSPRTDRRVKTGQNQMPKVGGSRTDDSTGEFRPNGADYSKHRLANPVRSVGWEPGCKCGAGGTEQGVVPCVVLDPFVGSGTTLAVCLDLGRRGWGVDLSEEYLRKNARVRLEGELMGRGLGKLVP